MNRRNAPFKKLTEEEMEEKCRRRLCYRPDEPFVPGHVCRNKHLHILILGEEEEEQVEGEQGEDGGDGVDSQTLQLHMSSVAGMTSLKSLKLWGTIFGKRVIVLVDSGASHNFISGDLVNSLGLQPEETKEYAVEVGDGHMIKRKGMCRNVELKLLNMDVIQNFYLFELGGVDVVLGYEWLEGLGDIQANFREHLLKVKVKVGGEIVEIKGDPALSRTVASLKAMMKELSRESEAYYIELGMMTLCLQEERGRVDGMKELLEEFQELFNEVIELPPERSCDHAIVIKEGSSIRNFRPYRYPHHQKDEIEKFVRYVVSWVDSS